jgi:2-dehydro-3-deoxyphosphogluconate aldolase / (4S)-4-hydroxy-2-oxoglutarate aldolase
VSDRVVAEIGRRRVVAVLRAESAAAAVSAARALSRGGVTAVEVAFTTPGAAEAIGELAADPDSLLVGAGTVTTAGEAAAAVDAGAAFLVSPYFVDEVVEAGRRSGLLVLPGAFSPAEIAAAAAVSPVVKLFPGTAGGPPLLRSLRGPFPHVRFVPTGGVELGTVRAWFAAGAFAVGAGGDLCPAEAIARREWDALEARARAYADAAGIG